MNNAAATFALIASFDSHTREVQSFTLTASFADRETADAFAGQFPKACQMRAYNLGGDPEHTAMVRSTARLTSDGVNGGVNETGVKRYRAAVRACAKLGASITYTTPYGNSYPTREAFEAAIA